MATNALNPDILKRTPPQGGVVQPPRYSAGDLVADAARSAGFGRKKKPPASKGNPNYDPSGRWPSPAQEPGKGAADFVNGLLPQDAPGVIAGRHGAQYTSPQDFMRGGGSTPPAPAVPPAPGGGTLFHPQAARALQTTDKMQAAYGNVVPGVTAGVQDYFNPDRPYDKSGSFGGFLSDIGVGVGKLGRSLGEGAAAAYLHATRINNGAPAPAQTSATGGAATPAPAVPATAGPTGTPQTPAQTPAAGPATAGGGVAGQPMRVGGAVPSGTVGDFTRSVGANGAGQPQVRYDTPGGSSLSFAAPALGANAPLGDYLAEVNRAGGGSPSPLGLDAQTIAQANKAMREGRRGQGGLSIAGDYTGPTSTTGMSDQERAAFERQRQQDIAGNVARLDADRAALRDLQNTRRAMRGEPPVGTRRSGAVVSTGATDWQGAPEKQSSAVADAADYIKDMRLSPGRKAAMLADLAKSEASLGQRQAEAGATNAYREAELAQRRQTASDRLASDQAVARGQFDRDVFMKDYQAMLDQRQELSKASRAAASKTADGLFESLGKTLDPSKAVTPEEQAQVRDRLGMANVIGGNLLSRFPGRFNQGQLSGAVLGAVGQMPTYAQALEQAGGDAAAAQQSMGQAYDAAMQDVLTRLGLLGGHRG